MTNDMQRRGPTQDPVQLTRRGVFALAAALSGTTILGACTPGQTQQQSGLNGNTPIAVTLWDRDEAGYDQFMNVWQPMFNQKQNKVKVSWETRPPSWGEKLTTAIVAGTPPDSAAVFGQWFRALLEAKQAIALDKFIKGSNFDAADFVTGIYKGQNLSGQQIGIPQYINTNALWINKDTFRKQGVQLPQEGWTHDQFLDTLTKLTRGPAAQREVWGIGYSVGDPATRNLTIAWGQGVNYTDPKNPDVFTFNTPQNIKGLQWMHDMFWKHRVAARTTADRGGIAQTDAVLVQGNVAMMIEGTHILSEWKSKAQADWDIAPLPKGPGGRGERLSMDGYLIPQGVKNPDASWYLTQAITDKEANKMRAEILGLAPARKSQFDVWTKSVPGKNLKYALPTEEARVDIQSQWPRPTELRAVVDPIWKKIFEANEISVQDGVKQLQEAAVGVLGPQVPK